MAQSHAIPEDVLNSCVEFCIEEYVRLRKHRAMLRDKWFEGYTLEEIAEKYGITPAATKKVIYGIGDKILARARDMIK